MKARTVPTTSEDWATGTLDAAGGESGRHSYSGNSLAVSYPRAHGLSTDPAVPVLDVYPGEARPDRQKPVRLSL